MTSWIDMKFVLLHEAKNDDGIRQFFMEVWELYVKVRGIFGERSWLKLTIDAHESVPHRTHGCSEQCV